MKAREAAGSLDRPRAFLGKRGDDSKSIPRTFVCESVHESFRHRCSRRGRSRPPRYCAASSACPKPIPASGLPRISPQQNRLCGPVHADLVISDAAVQIEHAVVIGVDRRIVSLWQPA